MDLDDELGGVDGVVDEKDCAVVEIEVDVVAVVVKFAVTADEPSSVFVSSTETPIVISVIAETPPRSSETTRIVTVTVSPVLVFITGEEEKEYEEEGDVKKMPRVPAGVITGTVDVEQVVELT